MQSLLGTNHRLPLSHLAKIYIWLEEKKERINDFSIGYMIKPKLNTNKVFKELVNNCMKTTFVAITRPNINKISTKKNARVLELLMFNETRKHSKKAFKVLIFVIYTIISNHFCIDYLASE